MSTPITALYAAICAAMMLSLGYAVVRARNRYRTSLGTGTEPAMEQAVRVHGNFVENVPTALILLLVGELNGTAPWLLHAFGATLVVGRALHAWGLSHKRGRSPGRFWGTASTWVVIAALALNALRFAVP